MINRLSLVSLISAAILLSSNITFASEKLAPSGSKQGPEIFVQLGHSGEISSMAFSRDGKYMATGSGDNTIKLWEVSSGREIKTLKGHGSGVIALAFLNDGKSLASAGGSFDETIRIWDIATGKETFKFPTNFFKDDGSKIVRFSENGAYAIVARSASSSFGGDPSTKIKVVETATGREVRDLSGIKGAEQRSASPPNSPSRSFKKAIFSPDGKQVLAVFDYSLKLLDVNSGKVIRTYQAEKYPISPNMKSAAFSPDGELILSSTLGDGLVLFDTATGRVIAMFGEDSSPDEVLFSPDGKYAVSAETDPNGGIQFWDIAGRRMVKTITHGSYISPGGYGYISFAFTPSSTYLASGGRDKTVKLWDIRSGTEVRRFSGAVAGVPSVDVSPDGRYVLSASGRDVILWDMAAGRRERVFRGHADTVNAVMFSPDGKYALSASGSYDGIVDNTLRLWDIATGKEIRKFIGHGSSVVAAVFSPDGRLILSGAGGKHDPTARLWDVATGTEIKRFDHSIIVKGFSPGETRNAGGWSFHLGFSKDGGTAVISRQDHTDIYNVKTHYDVYDTSTWRKKRTITIGGYSSSTFSPDGNYLLVGHQLIEVSTGNKRREYDNRNFVNSVAFSPDMNYFVQGVQVRHERGWDRRLEIRETAYGRVVKTLDGHTDDILRVKFTTDGKGIVSSSMDGTVRIWGAGTGKEIAQFISFTDGEWIVITPEGYYNSSANGDKHLNVRIGNNVYGIDQYRATYYKPQIVEAALRLGDTQKAITDVIGSVKEIPTVASIQTIEPPFIVVKYPEEGKRISAASTDLSLHIEDRNQTIKKVMVFINGRAAASGKSRGVKIISREGGDIVFPEGKKILDLKIPVTLDKGENLIEIAAFNGFSEGRRTIRVYSEDKIAKKEAVILPNLWILSIGINKYQDKRLTSLSYAVADAEGIVEAFKTQKGKLFREINSLIISDTSAIKPTFDNVIDNLNYVKKAGHNDVVLLFIAGHGMNDDSGEFYFLPNDAAILEDGSIKRSKAISWREIKSMLDIPAKKLIFADTCHSEGVSGKKTRGVDNDRFVKELQEANAVIFTSSRGRELSQESDKWKHGAFTYALIEGIKGKADLIKDNKISMKELDAYVSETVPKITNGAQHPITNTPEGYVNFPVAVLE